ncbi:MAG TPA: ferrous iron transport protein B [Vicinamibacterales bacterium]|nr:ferrous iron transport protein B [Vicinamibacterales bacterium]
MKGDGVRAVVLVGNPSVGKSTLFSQLTGVGVLISNYPGATVEVARGRVRHDEFALELFDLPGVYSLDTDGPEERAVRRCLADGPPDVVLNVVDASRLERNLYLTLELLELGLPVVVALHMNEDATRRGMSIDVERLAVLLGVPVVLVSARSGQGLEELVHALGAPPDPGRNRQVGYPRCVEAALRKAQSLGLSRRRAMTLLASGAATDETPEVLAAIAAARAEAECRRGASIAELAAGSRYGDAGLIAQEVTRRRPARRLRRERFDDILMHPFAGLALVGATLLAMLLVVFFLGGFLEEWIVGGLDRLVLVPVRTALEGLGLLEVVVEYTLIGVQAGLGIVVPYIMTFYVLMALMENSGYLTRAAFLLDAPMHRLGLHGRSMIPLILGFGCSVPALMATKSLQTRRERVVTSALVSLVPCSARTIVILGLVAHFVSVWAALSIYLLMLVLIVIAGFILGRTVKGERTGFVLEMVPLRAPAVREVAEKTWMQMKEFVFLAFPLLIAGSAMLGALQHLGILGAVNAALSPITSGWLGLPEYSATALLFGVLRKEMALETLAVMAGTADFGSVLTPLQMYVFAVFTSIYVPCLASMAVLKRVLGWRDMAWITAFTVGLAFLLSGLINQALV